MSPLFIWPLIGPLFAIAFIKMSVRGSVDEQLELSLYEESDENHRLDNLNLFIYMMLLVLTILTAWFFKHFRNRYIHETGLAVVYGLLIGILIHETSPPKNENAVKFDYPVNISQKDPLPKRIVLVTCVAKDALTNCSNSTSPKYFDYSFNSELDASQKQTDQVDLSSKATFDPEVFFNLVLPAIIFNAGYSLKRKHFFVNIGAILLYAFVGTAISAVAIGSIIYAFCLIPISNFIELNFSFNDAMLFGSIISATDPVSVLAIFSELGVDVDLHALILGESVLNDAVAIVLTGAVMGYAKAGVSEGDTGSAQAIAIASAIGNFFKVFLGAFAIGTTTSVVTSLITKFTKLREFPLLESSLFLLMSYSTFLAAEAASFSGIVALLFCGIFQAHYTYYNLSDESRTSLRYITELLSFLAENFCFVQIGVTIFTFSHHNWDAYFIMVSIFAIFVGRAVNVYPLSFIFNRFARRKVPWSFQHMMMFAGLRGAMAFALAIRETNTLKQRTMFTTTLILVIVTIIFCGALVTPMLQLFHIRVGVSPAAHSSSVLAKRRSGSRSSSGHANVQHDEENDSMKNETPMDEMTIVASDENDVIDMVSSTTVNTPRHLYSSKVIRGWKNVDKNYLKPLFTQCRPLLTETLPQNKICQWFARILTTTQQFEQGGIDNRPNQNDVGPTPCPFVENINDTDDEPIMLSSDSPNIAGMESDNGASNRKASGSFTSNSSNSRFH